MLSNWLWISHCGDYWQQAELRTDGARWIMMMMMTDTELSSYIHSAVIWKLNCLSERITSTLVTVSTCKSRRSGEHNFSNHHHDHHQLWGILSHSGIARNFSQGVRNSIIVSNFQPTPFTVPVESGTFDSRTRHLLPHSHNRNLTEVAEMQHGDRRRQCGTLLVAACTPSTFSTKNSASSSALMSVESNAGFVTWQDWWK